MGSIAGNYSKVFQPNQLIMGSKSSKTDLLAEQRFAEMYAERIRINHEGMNTIDAGYLETFLEVELKKEMTKKVKVHAEKYELFKLQEIADATAVDLKPQKVNIITVGKKGPYKKKKYNHVQVIDCRNLIRKIREKCEYETPMGHSLIAAREREALRECNDHEM